MLTGNVIQPDKYPPNVINQIPLPWHPMFKGKYSTTVDDFRSKFDNYDELVNAVRTAPYVPAFTDIDKTFAVNENLHIPPEFLDVMIQNIDSLAPKEAAVYLAILLSR
eukprot:441178_1